MTRHDLATGLGSSTPKWPIMGFVLAAIGDPGTRRDGVRDG